MSFLIEISSWNQDLDVSGFRHQLINGISRGGRGVD